jgi:putative (di)nucleoside polyphosphate hydrolase
MSKSYRPCVGIMLINTLGKVFVAKRIDVDGWQMPQGGIDAGESPEMAARRELYEETGVQSVNLVHESLNWYSYDFPDSVRHNVWGGVFAGQRQKWFLMEFIGDEGEVLLCKPSHKQEFSEYRWVSMDNMIELAVSFKKDTYKSVVNEFQKDIDRYIRRA